MKQYRNLQPHKNSIAAQLAQEGEGFKNHPGEPPFNKNERMVLAAFHSYQMGRIGDQALDEVMRPIPLNDMACGLDRLHVSANHGVPATATMNKYIDVMHDKIKGGDSFMPNDHLTGRVEGLKTWLNGADRGRPRMLSAAALQKHNDPEASSDTPAHTVTPALQRLGLQEFIPRGEGKLVLDGLTQAREREIEWTAKSAKSRPGGGSSPG